MPEYQKLLRLQLFLNVVGVISVILFGGLFILTATDAAIMQEAGALRFLRWEPFSKHVELMIEIVYFVWGIFLLLAARKPLQYLSFINFTIWANLAHGLLMVPQSHVLAGYHYKLSTDVAYCLILAVGPLILRPRGPEVRSA
jgi:hypothetical protein